MKRGPLSHSVDEGSLETEDILHLCGASEAAPAPSVFVWEMGCAGLEAHALPLEPSAVFSLAGLSGECDRSQLMDKWTDCFLD